MTLAFAFYITLLLINQFAPISSCDIWKAAECPSGPSKDDEDLMKSHTYTEEQLSAYCEAGKVFQDCVNEHLLCCDMKHEYNAALTSLDLQLKRNVVRLGKYCPEMNQTNPIQYRCRTTIQLIPGTRSYRRTTRKRSKPICDVERAASECNPMVENRVRFNLRWTAQEKVQWCKDMTEYDRCVKSWIQNCSSKSMTNEMNQMLMFIDYVQKSANQQCPGGIAGCGHGFSSNDSACLDPLSFFLEQNLRFNHSDAIESNRFLVNFFLLLLLALLLID